MRESDDVRDVVAESVTEAAELVMVALAVSVTKTEEEVESVVVTDAVESVVETLGSPDAVEPGGLVEVESTVDAGAVLAVEEPAGGTEVFPPVDPLLVGFIAIVHFLTSSTAGCPSCPTTGVSVMTHVSVIKPAILGED